MSEDAQEKQHQATGKHLSDLKKRGIVVRSKDLSGALVFSVMVALLILLSNNFFLSIKETFIISFSSISNVLNDSSYFNFVLKKVLIQNFYQLLPLFMIVTIVAILSPFVFGGWNFTLDVIQFNLSKLNPSSNIKKIFSYKQAGIEILRSMAKAFVFLSILIYFMMINFKYIVSMIHLNPVSAIILSESIIKSFIFYLSASLILTVAMDMAYHYFQYQEQSKMSLQEVKDEQKNTEGSVETKRKIRSKQVALLKQRIGYVVPKASVVITNPTHYAIALSYHRDKDKAPKVISKGKGIIAHQIKKIATLHGVTIYQAPALARAIYYTSKIGAEIHPGLYKAVAIVLSYVYQLKNYQYGIGDYPEIIDNLEIPKELIYDE